MMDNKGASLVLRIIVVTVVLLAVGLVISAGAIEPAKGGLGNLNDTLSEESVCGEYTSSGCCNNADGTTCEDLRDEWDENDNLKGSIEDACC